MMKRSILATLMILAALLLADCTKKKNDADVGAEIEDITEYEFDIEKKAFREIDLRIDADMPRINTGTNVGGDMLVNFIQPCKGKLDNLPGELMDLADREAVAAWIADSEEQDIIPSRLDEYVNIYSFIHAFNIPEADARAVLQEYLEVDYLPEDLAFTEEDLTVLFSEDETEIARHFASDYSIVIGEYVYSPRWMYFHMAEDYQEVGITPEMIQEKIEYYSGIPLSVNARNAFADKLGEFVGEEVVFSTDILEQWYGGLYYDFEGYYLDTGTEMFDIEWLSTHTIQDYAENGITADMLEEILSQISEFNESDEYDWINSCLMRMQEQN